ncbi:MAG: class I SAM-dependent methyltransferase [Clostridiales bacterium]|nr:class I SAM-dependent methyltransferase [Clostridiales bacterium]
MGFSENLLVALNRGFKLPVHPFNLQNDGAKTYAEWQFEKGAETLRFYLAFASADEMFRGKTVLDVGCGAAGKTVYYATLGARRVVGLEILEKYRAEADALAAQKGCADRFEFVCADAKDTGLPAASFDTVIMNDAVEHVGDPEAVLRECLRLTAPGGRLYLNFPPYYHPYGAHLSDAVAVPWVHAFFSERTLVPVYKRLVRGLPDEAERIDFRISTRPDGTEYFSYINHMTIRRFRRILSALPARCPYYFEAPLRGFLTGPARLPGLKEFFVKMVVAVLEPVAA